MFRRIPITNGVTLRQLINNISSWEPYMSSNDKKLSNIAEWIMKITVLTSGSLLHREISGKELYLSNEQENKVMQSYFGNHFPKYSRFNQIDNEINNRLKKWASQAPRADEFYNLLARKFHLWMIVYKRGDKNFPDQTRLMSWFTGELGFYYVLDHSQYCSLLSAVKQIGYDIKIPINDDEKSASLELFSRSRKNYNSVLLHRNNSSRFFPAEYEQAVKECELATSDKRFGYF